MKFRARVPVFLVLIAGILLLPSRGNAQTAVEAAEPAAEAVKTAGDLSPPDPAP
jgi:hypothetical protein